MRKKILHLIRSPFTIYPFDRWLASLMKICSERNLLRKFIPANDRFKAGTMRTCRRGGINYFLDISDYQSWLIYFSSGADSSLSIAKYAKKGDYIFDIGGNIGQTALTLSHIVGAEGKIICFEPYPDTLVRLNHNLSLNQENNNIDVVEVGLGDAPGSFIMYQDCVTNSGANRIMPRGADNLPGMKTIEISTLDIVANSLNLKKLDIIKIDVEGFEYRVLKGGYEVINKFKPNIYLEIDQNNLEKQGDSVDKIFSFLNLLGYEIIDVQNDRSVVDFQYLVDTHTDIYCTISSKQRGLKS